MLETSRSHRQLQKGGCVRLDLVVFIRKLPQECRFRHNVIFLAERFLS